MLVSYDPAVRATYVRLNDRDVTSTAEVSDLVMVDLDEYGHPVGIEFLMLPDRISEAVLRRLVERFPTLKPLAEDAEHWLPPAQSPIARTSVPLRA